MKENSFDISNVSDTSEIISENRKILKLAFRLGTLLLTYGAEMYRVETSINYVCTAYGVDRVSAFSTPTLLVVTIERAGQTYTLSGRIRKICIDLDKVERLNATSVFICKHKPHFDEALERINQIESGSSYSFKVKILSYFLISSAFAVFFGATFVDGLIAGAISFLILVVSTVLNKFDCGFFFSTVACSFVISVLCRFLGNISIVSAVESTQIGLLMLVVPGIAITNCMREFISGELLAGYGKLMESLLTAIAMAIGVVCAGMIITLFY